MMVLFNEHGLHWLGISGKCVKCQEYDFLLEPEKGFSLFWNITDISISNR